MKTASGPIEVNGHRLQVWHGVHDAARPTLVFLHDSLGCIRLWRRFPEEVAEAAGCNLLVYDRRGYGQSEPFGPDPRTPAYLEEEADLLDALLRQLSIDQAILFGHSDGGSIALIAAAKYPARIRAVLSEAAHIFVEEVTLDGIRAAQSAYRDTDLRGRLLKYHGEKTDAVFRAWTDTWLRADFRGWSITHFLPQIRCPLLLIQGSADEYGSAAQVKGIRRSVRGPVSVFLPEGVGHTPHREAAAETAAQAIAFIRSVAG